ncbi:MAG TPA: EAL domain-containing protein [Xanthomonadaceae bacterium]|nr:EAL domain-containing protein [Xanthomonadaceae bacterium]
MAGKTPLKVLVVEDSRDDFELLVRELERGGFAPEAECVASGASLEQALDHGGWQLVIADYSMPGFTGTGALERVRGRGLDVPFIFVSGTIGEELAVQAMQSGAQDYVLKGNLKRLVPAVQRELEQARRRRAQAQSETGRRAAEQRLRLLQALTLAIVEAADVHAALSVTLQELCQITGWTLGQSWLPAAEGGRELECSPAWYCREPGLEPFRDASLARRFRPDEGLPGRAWASRRAVWIADCDRGPRLARADAAARVGLKSALAVPVLAADEVVAVLEFFLRAPRESDEELMALISSVAAQLGGAIQRKRAEQRLQYLAHHDSLTGLANRTLFRERLQQALVDAIRHGRTLGVAFIDLDRFKTINDSLGHDLGDLLLIEVAERLRRCVRGDDTLARLSGDEFALVMTHLRRADDATRVAQKLIEAFHAPFRVAGHELYTGASIGVTLHPDDGEDVEGLLRNADIAMYRAKELGGSGFQFYAREMTARARERLAMEGALRKALAQERFVLHYQPIMDLWRGRVDGFEALLRWHDADRGLVAPGEFVPVAEETGLIVRIGEWALFNACRSVAGLPGLARVSVNVSPRQFVQSDLPRLVSSALRRTGLDPHRLELEITEGVLMSRSDTVLSALYELSDLGVAFSIDDFGTGYSSLSYLKRLPIRSVKIDRSFIADLQQDESVAALVRGIISLSHDLGFEVVAEGVETHEQLDFLRAHACDKAQGYLFGHPRPEQDLASMLADSRPSPA